MCMPVFSYVVVDWKCWDFYFFKVCYGFYVLRFSVAMAAVPIKCPAWIHSGTTFCVLSAH